MSEALVNAVKNAAAIAFDLTEGFQKTITLTRKVSGSFDTATGDVSSTTQTQNVAAIVSGVKKEDRENNDIPENANTKILIQYSLLDWEPDTDATVTWSGSPVYRIEGAKADIAKATFTLWVEA